MNVKSILSNKGREVVTIAPTATLADAVKLLAEQGLTTPLLLADGLTDGEGGWLLFEFLEGAESLGEAWQKVESLPVLADEQSAG